MRTIKNYRGTRELTKAQDDAISLLSEGKEVDVNALSAVDKTTIGFCYHKGCYLEQDLGKAIDWFLLAAEENWHDAERNLGICYKEGLGVKVDYSKSAYWLERAANHGDANAMSFIAEMYYNGVGVNKDEEKAWHWMNKAMESAVETKDGFLLAWFGDQYHYGNGMFEKNLEKAKDFYFDAAELDSPLAILRLSAMIRQGEIDLDEEDADYLLASVIENHKDTVDDMLRFYRERKAMKDKESQSEKTEE